MVRARLALLSRELAKRNAKRALIVTGKTLGKSKLLDKVKAAAGSALAGVFAETSQHVPSKTVEALIAEARRLKADSFITFGGGTPNDTAKDAANVLLGGKLPGGIDLYGSPAPANPGADFPEIAIPTTLSAGEFTPFAGMTHEETREKGGVGEPRLQAQSGDSRSRVDAGNPGLAMGRHRDARARSRDRRRLLESA